MTAQSVVAISRYKLSSDTRQALEAKFICKVASWTLSDLRKVSSLALARKLLFSRCDVVVVPMASVNDEALLPILKFVASLIPAGRRVVLRWDGTEEAFSRLSQAASALGVLAASVAGYVAMLRNHGRSRELNAAERMTASLRANARIVAYLNANLWIGVKAGGSLAHVNGVVSALLNRGWGVDYFSFDGTVLRSEKASRRPLLWKKAIGLPLELNLQSVHRAIVAQMHAKLDSSEHAFLYQRLSLGNFSGVELSRSAGIPLVVEYNGSEVWIQNNWGRRLTFSQAAEDAEKAMFRHAALIVTVSDILRDELIARGVEPERIVAHPNGVDPELFDPARFTAKDIAVLRAGLEIEPDACVMTFLGTFEVWHGAEIFARAIRALVEADAEELQRLKIKFLFVGDGPRAPAVRELLRDGKYAPWVRFAGLVRQELGPIHIASSDICVSPQLQNSDGTRFFGSPTKLFEYMAMAKGIVASRLEQLAEVLSPSVTELSNASHPDPDENRLGVLTEPGNPKALADAILFLARSPQWRAQLGANARAVALARYTWGNQVDAVLARLKAITTAERGQIP
ncbi:MAG: glycosyltransferase [Proteobacteria bacterium]|nr:glycosyltransferase [Pseudomonadota bacterium]